jgi:hypothetical protein
MAHERDLGGEGPLLPEPLRVRTVTASNVEEETAGEPLATRDHVVIRRWAARYQASPATGEETASGPASGLHVTDGGAGIRFNFPAAGLFRPITWEEWFGNFDRHGLTFIYEHAAAGSSSAPRYRIVKTVE